VAEQPTTGTRDPDTLARIIQLGFGGDRARFNAFMDAVHAVLPEDAAVILRGSAVTGRRWADGAPFDADGPGTSDLDVTFIGGDLTRHWTEFYIPGLHTVPLSDEHPEAAPDLTPLRRALTQLARRPVNLQATTDMVQYLRDVVMQQPYYVLVGKVDDLQAGEPRAVDSGDASGG
jgi:hypothetical protein